MSSMLFFVVMFCGGIAVASQPSINGRLAQRVGAVESSCISFAVGTLVLFAVVLFGGRLANLRGIAEAHWWELTGGLLGAFFVTLTIVVVPRIGTASAMTATIAAQLITGLLLDQTGIFGFRTIPMDGKRALGVALILAGAGLVFRK
ncbi:MAG TPA: DMT family transporter [Geobacteraceae bacterium]|nr:DMT family transporter [Geobacteraceae bacterium]